jgi:threonine dehydratase
VRDRVSSIALAGEAALREAVAGVVLNERLVVEGAGATGVAAALSGALELRDQRVAIVLSGANIDAGKLKAIL